LRGPSVRAIMSGAWQNSRRGEPRTSYGGRRGGRLLWRSVRTVLTSCARQNSRRGEPSTSYGGGGGGGDGCGRVRAPWTTRASIDHGCISPSGCSIAGQVYVFAEIREGDSLGLRNDDVGLGEGKVGRVVGRSGAGDAVCTGQGSVIRSTGRVGKSIEIDAAGAGTGELQRESLAGAARRDCALSGGHLYNVRF
jgi:hypothetical protein